MNWYQSVMKTSPRTTPVSRGNYNLVPRADGVAMSVRAGCGTIYVVSSLFENDDYIQHDESVFNDIGSSFVCLKYHSRFWHSILLHCNLHPLVSQIVFHVR